MTHSEIGEVDPAVRQYIMSRSLQRTPPPPPSLPPCEYSLAGVSPPSTTTEPLREHSPAVVSPPSPPAGPSQIEQSLVNDAPTAPNTVAAFLPPHQHPSVVLTTPATTALNPSLEHSPAEPSVAPPMTLTHSSREHSPADVLAAPSVTLTNPLREHSPANVFMVPSSTFAHPSCEHSPAEILAAPSVTLTHTSREHSPANSSVQPSVTRNPTLAVRDRRTNIDGVPDVDHDEGDISSGDEGSDYGEDAAARKLARDIKRQHHIHVGPDTEEEDLEEDLALEDDVEISETEGEPARKKDSQSKRGGKRQVKGKGRATDPPRPVDQLAVDGFVDNDDEEEEEVDVEAVLREIDDAVADDDGSLTDGFQMDVDDVAASQPVRKPGPGPQLAKAKAAMARATYLKTLSEIATDTGKDIAVVEKWAGVGMQLWRSKNSATIFRQWYARDHKCPPGKLSVYWSGAMSHCCCVQAVWRNGIVPQPMHTGSTSKSTTLRRRRSETQRSSPYGTNCNSTPRLSEASQQRTRWTKRSTNA